MLPRPSPLPGSFLLLTLKLLAQFSSDSRRGGNISRNMSGCYFYSPSLLALLSFRKPTRGEGGRLSSGWRRCCAHFSLHISTSRSECLALPCVPFVVHLCLLLATAVAARCNPPTRTHTHTHTQSSIQSQHNNQCL